MKTGKLINIQGDKWKAKAISVDGELLMCWRTGEACKSNCVAWEEYEQRGNSVTYDKIRCKALPMKFLGNQDIAIVSEEK